MKLEFFMLIFEEYSNAKFNENPSSEGRVILCGRTERLTDGEANMTKLIVVFHNVAKAPKLCRTMCLFSIRFMTCSRHEHCGNQNKITVPVGDRTLLI